MTSSWTIWWGQVDLYIVLQMALAVVLGGVIGIERELHGRPAGLRTMALVCLGATLVMILSNRLLPQLPLGDHGALYRIDPGRTIAGVVTGIGFLGGGVILRLSDVLRGVTTAAAIWFVAALGVVIGQGELGIAMIAAAFGLTVLWVFQYLERPLHGQIYPTVHVVVTADMTAPALERAKTILSQHQMRLMDLKAAKDNAAEVTELHLFVRTQQHFQAPEVITAIAAIDGVQTVRWR